MLYAESHIIIYIHIYIYGNEDHVTNIAYIQYTEVHEPDYPYTKLSLAELLQDIANKDLYLIDRQPRHEDVQEEQEHEQKDEEQEGDEMLERSEMRNAAVTVNDAREMRLSCLLLRCSKIGLVCGARTEDTGK